MALAMLVVKATVILLSAMGVAFFCRRAPGRVHQSWTLAFVAVLALPLLAAVLPPLDVPVPAAWQQNASAEPPAAAAHAPAGPSLDASAFRDSGVAPRVDSARTVLTWPTAMGMTAGLWVAGTACALIMLAVSLWRVRRLAASATEVTDADWRLAAGALAGRLGLPQSVRLLLTDRLNTPMAGGFRRPTIFLPVSCAAWSAECRDAVFAHELVHLARRDPLRHLAARLTLAIYWFHPAAWLAAHWAALACEDACDEEVVRCGIRPSSYARILLELAQSAGQRRAPLGTLSIVQPSRLERRLTMILNNDLAPQRRRTLPLLAAGAVLTIVLAAAHPAASAAPPPARVASLQPAPACESDWVEGFDAGGDTAPDPSGRMEYRERIGDRGFTRSIVKGFGDLRLCLLAEETGDVLQPSRIARQAPRVVLEARRPGIVQRLEMTNGADAIWRVNGAARPAGAATAEWRRHLLGVLDATWELARIRGNARLRQDDWRTAELEASTQEGLARLLRIIHAETPMPARPSAD